MDTSQKILHDKDGHKCVMFSFDDESQQDSYLSVNQYLIVNKGVGILIDPGSQVIFDELYNAVSEHVEIENIKYIFCSHQDPDVSGSIAQWSVATNAKFVMSTLWVRFMSHYGFLDMSRIITIEDKGAKLKFGENSLDFLPAHFLHSPGNFSLYDTESKIVFSGDIGAAVVASPCGYKKVENFEQHKEHLEVFHKRYMASNKLCRAWVSKIEKLDVSIIAPQHGLVFEHQNVKLFLEWLKHLQCGSDLLDEIY